MYKHLVLCAGLLLMGCHSSTHSLNSRGSITTFDEQQMARVSGDTFMKLHDSKSEDGIAAPPFAELETLCSQYAPHLAPAKNKNLFTDAMRKGYFSRFQSAMKTDYDKDMYSNMSIGFISVAFDVCESAWQQSHA